MTRVIYLGILNVCVRARRDVRHYEDDSDSSLAEWFDNIQFRIESPMSVLFGLEPKRNSFGSLW